MLCFSVVVIIIVILLVVYYKNFEVDLTLKFYELLGKKVEELRGRVVWITGASSGIGEYLAYELARAGCKLVLSARRQQELERVKARCCEIGKLEDNDVLVLPMDLCKFDTHKTAVKDVLDHFNQIDILVNNSGRSQRGFDVNTDFRVVQGLFEVNVMGTISLTKAVLPQMIERQAGHIVVVSSVAGKFGVASSCIYSATKFALQGYFFSLRQEVFGKGIDVSIVCPGPIKSSIVENAATESFGKSVKDDKDYEEGFLKKMDTDTFAKLMAIAVVNKVDECWISPQPVLLITYVSQYIPSIFNWIMKRYGLIRIEKLRIFAKSTTKKED